MNAKKLFARSLVGLIVISCYAAASQAGIIYLKNGDRITGSIDHIWDNEVFIEPAYVDDTTINISLDAVAYMESERAFDVTLKDGRKVTARLGGKAGNGDQLILLDDQMMTVPINRLEELDEIDEYFDWESHFDVSVGVNKGNTDNSSGRFFADTDVKLGDHRHIASLTLNREEQNSVTVKEQDILRYNYNWLFSDPWFFGLNTSVERDPIRNLNYRFIGGATAGRDIFNKPRLFLNFQAGAGYLTEEDTLSESQSSAVANWALRYRQKFFSNNLELYHDDSLNWYLTGRANTVIKTTTGLRFDLGNDLLYLTTSIDYNFETSPIEGAENYDLAFLFGLGIEL